MGQRCSRGSTRPGRPRAALVVSLGLLVPVLLGCLGVGIQLGPLGLQIGQLDVLKEPPTPAPETLKETTVTEGPDGTLCQEGELRLPPRACTAVYYLRPFATTPHLDLVEPAVGPVRGLITEQTPDHFTIKNTGLLLGHTFTWRARGMSPVPRPAGEAPAQPPGPGK